MADFNPQVKSGKPIVILTLQKSNISTPTFFSILWINLQVGLKLLVDELPQKSSRTESKPSLLVLMRKE